MAAVVNIAEPLSCIFFCAALMIYLSGTRQAVSVESSSIASCANNAETEGKPSSSSLLTGVWACVKAFSLMNFWTFSLIVSILFKETGITVLGVIFGASVLKMLAFFLNRIFISSPGARAAQQLPWTTHLGWLLGTLVMLVGYFVFRALIVSPARDALFSFDWAQADKCDNSFSSVLNLVVDKFTSIGLIISSSINMLRHLLSSPLMSLRRLFLSGVEGGEALAAAAAPDISSFYLDDSALIRKAENPFAFLHGQEKVLSLMHLHVRYLMLLLWPVQLSPEYAFNCIPSVASWQDEGRYRAVVAVAMYASIATIALCGLWSMVKRGERASRGGLSGHAMLLSLMLLVIPFIPASGVS